MPTEEVTDQETETTTETPAPETDADHGDDLGEAGLKALKAEREANKALKAEHAAALARLKEIEDKDKSAEQKRAEELETVTKERDALTVSLAKSQAAIKHGLSTDDLDLIGGSTPEEIEQRAAKLAARVNSLQPSADPHLGRETPPKGGSTATGSSDWLREKFTDR